MLWLLELVAQLLGFDRELATNSILDLEDGRVEGLRSEGTHFGRSKGERPGQKGTK